jgi:hypothetical protein
MHIAQAECKFLVKICTVAVFSAAINFQSLLAFFSCREGGVGILLKLLYFASVVEIVRNFFTRSIPGYSNLYIVFPPLRNRV